MPLPPRNDDRPVPVVVLIGATASGKTALAVRLAQRLIADGRPAEIVNTDSMLVYRGMDIGTAKPTAAERGGVPHHLIDIADITEAASVADFQQLARGVIADCRTRGVVPIVVGGSALYVRAIIDEFEFPGTDPATRARLEAELAATGSEELHARLAGIDPAAAAAIQPGNGRRIVRALEVIELTGRPYTASLPEPRYALDQVVQIGLDVPRPVLDERIARRVDQMWQDGLVDEVLELERRGLRDGLTAARALGYRQILQFLDGEYDEQQARQRTVTQTRKFARRQDSWFRRDNRIQWLAADAPELVDRALALVGITSPIGWHTGPVQPISFAKGHGTENDFVIIPDPDGALELSRSEVALLCDRHAGIGADGILRVVRSEHIAEWDGEPDLWFMDYRNADGSIAEMCGNGVRVFARYLLDHGLADGPVIDIATRAGLRPAEILADGQVRVAMGPVSVGPDPLLVTPAGADVPLTAFPADVGNPHAVAFVDDLDQLDLHRSPRWSDEDRFPDGVNVEFVRRLGDTRVAMRVYERGSGETRSCGTGTVAVAAVAAARAGQHQRPLTYRVDVPGGSVQVELAERQSYLTGPAVIVAEGTWLLG